MRRTVPAVAVMLLTTACGSSTPHATPPLAVKSSQPESAAPSVNPTPTKTSGSPAVSAAPGSSNITRSRQGKYLPPGPFKITPIKCGTYTEAEKNQFSTNAKGGLVFKYTNVSNSLTDRPSLTVNFLNGSNVVGNNVSGSAPQIGPGQSAESAVDATNGSDYSFTSCELMTYGLSQGGGTDFAP